MQNFLIIFSHPFHALIFVFECSFNFQVSGDCSSYGQFCPISFFDFLSNGINSLWGINQNTFSTTTNKSIPEAKGECSLASRYLASWKLKVLSVSLELRDLSESYIFKGNVEGTCSLHLSFNSHLVVSRKHNPSLFWYHDKFKRCQFNAL